MLQLMKFLLLSSNMTIYSPFSKDNQIKISEVAKFFNTLSKTNIGLTYLRDIIRRNIYSIVIDSILNTNNTKWPMKMNNNKQNTYVGLWQQNYKYNMLRQVM